MSGWGLCDGTWLIELHELRCRQIPGNARRHGLRGVPIRSSPVKSWARRVRRVPGKSYAVPPRSYPEPHTRDAQPCNNLIQTGKYTESDGSSVCEPCSSPLTTSGAGATSCDACEKGSYKDVDESQEDVCRPCPEGVKCDTPGKLQTLELESGWNRLSSTSRMVYECNTGNCLGGNSSTCLDGSGGVLCSVFDSEFLGTK